MNEKIKELMLKAGYASPELAGRAKLLAELIIQDCLDCSTWVGRFNKTPVEPIHTSEAVNRRIKQHFGVKE